MGTPSGLVLIAILALTLPPLQALPERLVNMAMTAATHVAASQVPGTPTPPNIGGGAYNGEILLLLVSSAGIIFIDGVRKGEGVEGQQFIALGVAGFILLFLGQFFPEIAFAFTLLFFVGVLLNSPDGIPFVSSGGSGSSSTTSSSATAPTGGSSHPIINADGGAGTSSSYIPN
jgi:hypothetical protein